VPQREQRKTVTVLFADVTGSTGLGERLDPESLRRVMSRYFSEMSAIVERHGGTVEKFIGDAVMAVFGAPVLHEDDAVRAIRAAADMRVALASLNQVLQRDHGVMLRVRTGINTGEVVVGDLVAGQIFVTGDAVNVAARLEQSAEPGEILLGEDTFRLVRDVVEVDPVDPMALRGREERVRAYRLLGVREIDGWPARSLRSPMVGRVAELARMWESFDAMVRDGTCHLVTVLGAAGVGKSRFVHEFLDGLGEQVTALRGRCLPYGEGITFWPVGEVVRQACGIPSDAPPAEARARLAAGLEDEERADRIVEGVAGVMGLAGASGTPEETFWAIRRFLEVLSRERPAVVVFDDVHWGEPTFLDLVEYLSDFVSGPVLILCVARPDLLDVRPSWGAGRRRAASIALEPLTEEETAVLIANLLEHADLEERTRSHIADASEGNPLFVEETLRMMVDDGVLERTPAGWITARDPSSLTVPPTISALLSARLERLDQEERAVAQRASVVGKVFYWGAVAELTPSEARARVGGHLQSLVRKELISPDLSSFAGEDAFRFRHLLVRDAAYRAIPKEARADLHERFAAWLEAKAGDRVSEYEEILGHHLEQAHRYLLDLGATDGRAAELGSRAAGRLASSGRRALARGDVPGAVNLFERASALVPAGDPSRLGLLTDLGEALHARGELARAEGVFTEAVEGATSSGERGAAARARLGRLFLRIYTDPEGRTEEIRAEVERAIPVFEELDDQEGLARTARLLTEIDWMACRYTEVERSLERAIEHARHAGDRWSETLCLARLAATVHLGPTPAESGIRRCREILERSGGDRRVEAAVLGAEAQLRAMLGRFAGTREQIERSRLIREDFGATFYSTESSAALAFVEMLADNPAAAERELRLGYETLEEMGERGYLSTAASELAQAIYAQGRYEEAEEFASISLEAAGSDDVASQVTSRAVVGKVLARQGQIERADRMVREAVEVIERTDALNMQGDTLLDLAEILALAGRGGDARSVLDDAATRYERKGNLVSLRRTRSAAEAAVRGEWPPGA
jgi:class 3 adenylate cyclase/tetratricopeptide (TPR) repeat protein